MSPFSALLDVVLSSPVTMMELMVETVPTLFGLCACGQSLPSAGAKQCPRCRAAHARSHIKERAAMLRRLPLRAMPLAETTWVACNLYAKPPDFHTAPSREAVSLLAAIKADDKLQRTFWATHLKARLKRPYD